MRVASRRVLRRGSGPFVLVPMLLFVASWLLRPLPAAGQNAGPGNLMSAGEALREIFPGAAFVEERTWSPDAEQRAALEHTLGRRLDAEAFAFRMVYDAQRRFLGAGMVTEERGKYRPITFMVGVTPDVKVKDVAVMAYRESRGGEVRHTRFLRQYRGKTVRDPVRAGRDIVNITGATISVQSMNNGVRKVLAVSQLALPALLRAPPGELTPLSTSK